KNSFFFFFSKYDREVIYSGCNNIVIISNMVGENVKKSSDRSVSMSVSVRMDDLKKVERICDQKHTSVSEAVRMCISHGYARMVEQGIISGGKDEGTSHT
ncbi:hypothetical protein DRN85_06090, partial [Methanosarcinales archaeon]